MRFFIFLFLLIYLISGYSCEAQQVIIQGKERKDYLTQVLEKALSYFPEKNYKLRFHNKDIPKLRVLQVLTRDEGIDVIAGGATQAREEMLHPIRIPLLKGLHGWRIALVTSENRNIFLSHKSLTSFKKLIPGQLHSWSDTRILETNGIFVEKGSDYNGLFEMLASGRFDYFPRAVIEVEKEYQNNKDKNLIIEPHTLIHYPTAYYFYVNKHNTSLASDIKQGLELAIADGSFNSLFNQYYGETIMKIRSQNRNVFRLVNPLLSESTPLERSELWLNLAAK